MMTRFKASASLYIAAAMLAGHAQVGDVAAQSVEEATSADDSAAKERYEQLMEQAEGNGRSCMIANTFKDETLEALRGFGKSVHFIDLNPHKPIKLELPESYYHPLGRTITFDQFELAIDRTDPSKPYISMTRTAEGVKLEPKVAIRLKDGKILCVRNLSATVRYKTQVP